MSRYFIDPKNDKIFREDIYHVSLKKSNGEVIDQLEPKRLFPNTDPDRYITLISKDLKEVAVIKDVRELSAESADAVKSCFDDIYFVPVITRVVSMSVKSGALRFVVETDRGPTSFSVNHGVLDITRNDDDSLIIRDNNDNRYIIRDVEKMDKMSKHYLFSFRC